MIPIYHPTVATLVGQPSEELARCASILKASGDTEVIDNWQACARQLANDHATNTSAKAYVPPFDLASQSFDDGLIGGEISLVVMRALGVGELLNDHKRMRRTSVVAMVASAADEQFLSFSASISSFPPRKLLITTRSDMENAVRAINGRLTDSVIFIDTVDFETDLLNQIEKSKHEYFEYSTATLRALLSSGATSFICVPAVKMAIEHLIQYLGICEHYVSSSPPGVLLIDRDGNKAFLIVSHDESRRAHKEIAAAQNAPADLLARLEGSRSVAHFPTASGFYDPDVAHHWQDFVWTGDAFENAPGWLSTLVRDKPATHGIFETLKFASNRF